MEKNEKKPIIIHIENENVFTGMNTSRDAFAHILRNDFNLEVFIYRHSLHFEDDLERLKKYFDRHQVILIIVDQEGECDQHKEIISLVQQKLLNIIPIAVLINPRYENHFKEVKDGLLYAFTKESELLINLIRKLTENWVLAHNWFDERTNNDQAALMFKLENSYLSNYPEEEEDSGDFCPKDYNHMIIAQALRTRLYPGSIVQEEFHKTIPNSESPNFTRIKSSVYEEELARIQGLSKDEQADLYQKMCNTLEGGVSCGRNVKGFAIDPVTLEYLITSREGQHYGAGSLLFYRIVEIDWLKASYFKGKAIDDDDCKARIITGLIFKVSEYQTPILHFERAVKKHVKNEALERVIAFLKEQQMFIPTHSGAQPF